MKKPSPQPQTVHQAALNISGSNDLVIGIDLKRSPGSEAAMKALAKAIRANAEAAKALAQAFSEPRVNGPVNTFTFGKAE